MKKLKAILIITTLTLIVSCSKKIDYRCNCNEPTQSGSTVYSYMIWENTLEDATNECTSNQYCELQDI